MRMQMANRLLVETKSTTEEIMYKVGYDNRSTLYKNFKENMGSLRKNIESKPIIKPNI